MFFHYAMQLPLCVCTSPLKWIQRNATQQRSQPKSQVLNSVEVRKRSDDAHNERERAAKLACTIASWWRRSGRGTCIARLTWLRSAAARSGRVAVWHRDGVWRWVRGARRCSGIRRSRGSAVDARCVDRCDGSLGRSVGWTDDPACAVGARC